MLATCQALRSKDGKDALTLSAPMEAWQRDQHPRKGVGAQGEPHISLKIFMVFKKVSDMEGWAFQNDYYSGEITWW